MADLSVFANAAAARREIITKDGSGGFEDGDGNSYFYEGGSWTPALVNADGTLLVSDAYFTRIGRMIFYQIDIEYDGTPDASDFQISGLPYNIDNPALQGRGGGYISYNNTGLNIIVNYNANNYIELTDNSNINYSYGDIGSSRLGISGFYLKPQQ